MINILIKEEDRKRYVLAEKRDFEILEKIYKLKEHDLSKEDKEIIELIRTQLEKDWRKPLMQFLNKLIKKYD